MRTPTPWSISTTVRNPERLRDFLSVLSRLEGQAFDRQVQEHYQILLIQAKLYHPMRVPNEFTCYYDVPNEMPYDVAETLFHHQSYVDPPMRGRQSLNPLKKLGFVVIDPDSRVIQLTELGKKFLSEDYDIGSIFFKSLLKLQFPNPISEEFSAIQGFNIAPFIATLHIMKMLCERGFGALSRNEFCLFIPTLINAGNIDEQLQRIIAYRKSDDKQEFAKQYLRRFYNLSDLPETRVNNLRDYGDNAMRYFRLTRYFRVSLSPLGDDWNIELEPSRGKEIEQLTGQYSGEALPFEDVQQYLDYVGDFHAPRLPWEERDNLLMITLDLQKQLNELAGKNRIVLSEDQQRLLQQSLRDSSEPEIQEFLARLRTLQLEMARQLEKDRLRHNTDFLRESVTQLQNISRNSRKISPEQFEKLIHDLFHAVNDEIEIKPNYPVDDDGHPISHAPGNKSDIECFYQAFHATCEVTLDSSKNQWMREGQPVMRHLRDFENRSQSDDIYCIFIAPRIHRDTYSQFWISVRYEYDGQPQQIIPLSIEQLIQIIETILEQLDINQNFSHRTLQSFLKRVVMEVNLLAGFSEWIAHIEATLHQWQEEMEP